MKMRKKEAQKFAKNRLAQFFGRGPKNALKRNRTCKTGLGIPLKKKAQKWKVGEN